MTTKLNNGFVMFLMYIYKCCVCERIKNKKGKPTKKKNPVFLFSFFLLYGPLKKGGIRCVHARGWGDDRVGVGCNDP